ncbi:hypothetical protein DBIPINDM_004873 [Mesorhizobium sp. AR02]|uniref:hypothetical protein n=1 Tax=Mesorhizobium sp. AR02 TaxID=2865837 RepID=UPI00215E4E3C|nr:hypothetical protein [Mesorhizobium sp. AR02]UVK51585.1 hypothetical protein DBIPINDM_004873 [Mesorhizobium sp. AR02]
MTVRRPAGGMSDRAGHAVERFFHEAAFEGLEELATTSLSIAGSPMKSSPSIPSLSEHFPLARILAAIEGESLGSTAARQKPD